MILAESEWIEASAETEHLIAPFGLGLTILNVNSPDLNSYEIGLKANALSCPIKAIQQKHVR
jgi:hypothetical protein